MQEHGIDPARFGDLTYPQVVAILTKGKPDVRRDGAWQARKVLRDFKAGKIAWRD